MHRIWFYVLTREVIAEFKINFLNRSGKSFNKNNSNERMFIILSNVFAASHSKAVVTFLLPFGFSIFSFLCFIPCPLLAIKVECQLKVLCSIQFDKSVLYYYFVGYCDAKFA